MPEVPTAPPPAERDHTAEKRLERLGNTRDGLLLFAGGLYILGYVVWSVHALREGLGLLPALDLQYFLAGGLFAVSLLLAGALGYLAARVADASETWKASHRRGIRLVAPWVPIAIGLGVGIGGVLLMSAAGHLLVGFALTLAFGATLVAIGLIRPNARLALPIMLAGLSIFTASLVFVTLIYPNVPQEVGGVRPRCGYVELAAADASDDLAREILQNPNATGVARSKKLSIFFSGGESYVVRLRDGDNDKTYELRKETVKSTRAC